MDFSSLTLKVCGQPSLSLARLSAHELVPDLLRQARHLQFYRQVETREFASRKFCKFVELVDSVVCTLRPGLDRVPAYLASNACQHDTDHFCKSDGGRPGVGQIHSIPIPILVSVFVCVLVYLPIYWILSETATVQIETDRN